MSTVTSREGRACKGSEEMDKGILMADAVTAFEHKNVKNMGGTRLPTVQVETLELKI
jgi:hypothetical protein